MRADLVSRGPERILGRGAGSAELTRILPFRARESPQERRSRHSPTNPLGVGLRLLLALRAGGARPVQRLVRRQLLLCLVPPTQDRSRLLFNYQRSLQHGAASPLPTTMTCWMTAVAHSSTSSSSRGGSGIMTVKDIDEPLLRVVGALQLKEGVQLRVGSSDLFLRRKQLVS